MEMNNMKCELTPQEIVTYYREKCYDGELKNWTSSDGKQLTYENLLDASKEFISKDKFDKQLVDKVNAVLSEGLDLTTSIQVVIESFLDAVEEMRNLNAIIIPIESLPDDMQQEIVKQITSMMTGHKNERLQ